MERACDQDDGKDGNRIFGETRRACSYIYNVQRHLMQRPLFPRAMGPASPRIVVHTKMGDEVRHAMSCSGRANEASASICVPEIASVLESLWPSLRGLKTRGGETQLRYTSLKQEVCYLFIVVARNGAKCM